VYRYLLHYTKPLTSPPLPAGGTLAFTSYSELETPYHAAVNFTQACLASLTRGEHSTVTSLSNANVNANMRTTSAPFRSTSPVLSNLTSPLPTSSPPHPRRVSCSCVDASVALLRVFLLRALNTAREHWTQFNEPAMYSGCILLCTSVILLLVTAVAPGPQGPVPVPVPVPKPAGAYRRVSCAVRWSRSLGALHPPLSLSAIASGVPVSVIVIARLLALTSNSYINKEKDVVLCLCSTMMLVRRA
jgi:hypothetical protein